MGDEITIARALESDVEPARALMREYFATSAADPQFKRCVSTKGCEAEVTGLPGEYSPPGGRLLIARVRGEPAGCIALRAMSDASGIACEMKRLFVRPAFRRDGVGRALVVALLREAAEAGYRRMVLDTLPSMQAAQALYHDLGFRVISPSLSHPVAGAVFMERALT